MEIDIRDRRHELVLSHDPPANSDVLTLSAFLDLWMEKPDSGSSPSGLLAINVKSDGLAERLAREIHPRLYEEHSFFCFDMSFPQQRQYSLQGLPIASRISEYEPVDRLPATGWRSGDRVWLDCFETDWFLGSREITAMCLSSPVSIVSPEIHGRDPRFVWDWVASIDECSREISVCTDRPEELNEWLT